MNTLTTATNEELMQELLRRMNDFSKYQLMINKWNSFNFNDEGYAQHALKIAPRD